MDLAAVTTPKPATDGWPADLARRWANARRAALRTIVPEASPTASEQSLLQAASERDPEAVCRRVFDNSHTLGVGFRSFYRVDLTLVDLSTLLPRLGAPCASEGFDRDPAAREGRSDRAPCDSPACDYWREAMHGLVSGLSNGVYYSRVTSPASGGARCVDLLHVEARTDARFQPVPEAIHQALTSAGERVARMSPGATVELLGMAEGALHVMLHQRDPSCGLSLFPFLKRTLERAIPGISVLDASPRSVLDPNQQSPE